jgi:hypothetical protein
MQIVVSRIDRQTVHFEAPASAQGRSEMDIFFDWFNRTAPDGPAPLPALTRATTTGDQLEMGALNRTRERRNTRYWLPLTEPEGSGFMSDRQV